MKSFNNRCGVYTCLYKTTVPSIRDITGMMGIVRAFTPKCLYDDSHDQTNKLFLSSHIIYIYIHTYIYIFIYSHMCMCMHVRIKYSLRTIPRCSRNLIWGFHVRLRCRSRNVAEMQCKVENLQENLPKLVLMNSWVPSPLFVAEVPP